MKMTNDVDQIQVNIEEELLILCSRKELSNRGEERIKDILKSDIDLNRLIGLAIRHKVLPLISKHILKLSEGSNLSMQYKRFFEFSYLGNKKRNQALFNELAIVLDHFNNKGIDAIPLKGLVLTPLVYNDFGIRTLNDLDFLITLDLKSKVSNELKEIGYRMGKYDYFAKEFTPLSRKEELLWKMYAGNLFPHVKKVASEYLNYIEVDFSYDVDLNKNYNASKLLLESSVSTQLLGIRTKILSDLDFLIHICIHLYKEATNVQWILLHADLNLIKFCDLREYTIYISEKLDWTQLGLRAKELGAEEALFYSYYYLDFIYGEKYSEKLQTILEITDRTFLEKYGQFDYEKAKIWRKSFLERFFSYSNKDEVVETSKYQRYISGSDHN